MKSRQRHQQKALHVTYTWTTRRTSPSHNARAFVAGTEQQGWTSHSTHYIGHWGQFTGQMTQPTVSQHWMTTASQGSIPPCSAHKKVKIKVTTLQTMWNSLTIPWQFAALLCGTQHVKCYSYHARTSVTVSGGGRNATVHDLKPDT